MPDFAVPREPQISRPSGLPVLDYAPPEPREEHDWVVTVLLVVGLAALAIAMPFLLWLAFVLWAFSGINPG